MKCERFLTWLENRDTHDVSEAHRAHKHAAECQHCGGLLKKDEYLDWFIAKSMAGQSAPEELKARIDLSLNRSVVRRPGKGMIAAVAALCLIVAAIFAMNMGQERFATMDELGTFTLVDYRDHGQRESIYEPVACRAMAVSHQNSAGGLLPKE